MSAPGRGEGTPEDVLAWRARWALVEGEWQAVLPTLGVAAVDHIIGDPPYDERTHARARSLRDGGSDIPIDFAPLSDFHHLQASLLLARRWVVFFCALEQLGEYARAAGEAWLRAGVWVRPDGTPQISGDRPAQGAEGIAIAHAAGQAKAWNSGGKRGVWTHGVHRGDRLHPTQKPLPLMLELLEDFTGAGDVILDPFAGSGTTGQACMLLGRRFIGIERDPKYAAIARDRIGGGPTSLERNGQRPLFG
jgi:site-specific DNA-methyltransferase (adenine-specific)